MGWAKQNKPGPEDYPLRPAEEHAPAPRGVFTMDMPWGKGRRKVPKIKGLPESTEADPDYSPGGGTWHSV
jgi:hypothetical protein